MRTQEGKLRLFVAIDRTSKFACIEVHEKAGKMISAQFRRDLVEMLPCKIHTILTGNGIRFTNRKQDTSAFEHIFDRVCRGNGIEHRLTEIAHPWTNCQLKTHLADFVDAYNHARRLKALNRLAPCEYICKI